MLERDERPNSELWLVFGSGIWGLGTRGGAVARALDPQDPAVALEGKRHAFGSRTPCNYADLVPN